MLLRSSHAGWVTHVVNAALAGRPHYCTRYGTVTGQNGTGLAHPEHPERAVLAGEDGAELLAGVGAGVGGQAQEVVDAVGAEEVVAVLAVQVAVVDVAVTHKEAAALYPPTWSGMQVVCWWCANSVSAVCK